MPADILSQISAQVDRDRNELLAAIAESVKIPSVRQEPVEEMPFGEPINRALEHALGVGEQLGFRVGRLGGYAGWIDYGKGDELIGVLSHVDVVPIGNENDWEHPPFGAEVVDGMMYGRGTADDKGPLFSTLYGLKAVRDLGLPLTKRIRIILGTDEESGWGGVKRYLASEEIPSCAFSPDGLFTAVNREKGITVLRIVGCEPFRADRGLRLAYLRGGTAPNNVPDEAIACLKGTASSTGIIEDHIREWMRHRPDAAFDLQIENDGDSVLIISKGRAAHAMVPEEGINAIAELLGLLSRLEIAEDGATKFTSLLNDQIGLDTTGASLGIAWSDEPSGALTLNLGQIKVDAQQAFAVLDIRSPVSITCDDVVDAVTKALLEADDTIEIEVQKRSEPLYLPADHPLIETLSRAYHKVTGLPPILHSIGGGTYARAIQNCVCFGAIYPDEEITVHRPNERASIERMILNAKVYGFALYELAKQPEEEVNKWNST